MKCLQTNKVEPLDMVCKQIIDIVCFLPCWSLHDCNAQLQVYAECYKFMKSLKENSLPLADEVWKKYAGGYCLNDYNIETVILYIAQLTGLMVWDGEVTSIHFTCSSGVWILIETI
jgi:hypothetical protein